MRIEVVTSLYPSKERPHEGLFAERRWLGMGARGHEVHVTQPLPLAPPFVGGAWGELRRMAPIERRSGIDVERPRYLHLPGRDLSNLPRFARCAFALLCARRPEVVVADYAWPAAGLAPLLAAQGVPLVINGRGSDVLLVASQPACARVLGDSLRLAGSWCGVSQHLVQAMDDLARQPGRGRLVANGVDLDFFRPRERAAARRELGLPGDGPLVLVVGHLIERKDPCLALEVVARLKQPNVRCAFIGRGALEAELRERVRARGLERRARIVGEVAPGELALWYGAADALLLTSSREGRPNVVLEALASGLPVLATRTGGTGELLSFETERALSDSRSPEVLARMLAALLSDPPAGEDLRASVSHLSWEACLDSLQAVLAQALEPRP